jgi:hypothetical protein
MSSFNFEILSNMSKSDSPISIANNIIYKELKNLNCGIDYTDLYLNTNSKEVCQAVLIMSSIDMKFIKKVYADKTDELSKYKVQLLVDYFNSLPDDEKDEEQDETKNITKLLDLLRANYDSKICIDDVRSRIDTYDFDDKKQIIHFIYGLLTFPECVDPGASFMLNNMEQIVRYPSEQIIQLIKATKKDIENDEESNDEESNDEESNDEESNDEESNDEESNDEESNDEESNDDNEDQNNSE